MSEAYTMTMRSTTWVPIEIAEAFLKVRNPIEDRVMIHDDRRKERRRAEKRARRRRRAG